MKRVEWNMRKATVSPELNELNHVAQLAATARVLGIDEFAVNIWTAIPPPSLTIWNRVNRIVIKARSDINRRSNIYRMLAVSEANHDRLVVPSNLCFSVSV